ncbi:electron transport complex subunit RsxC [Deefgea salmonis]|uniref:Ion-translocating oxidoreductase complex subunit C n=1 Tax=Deefgea salmonis TaxID=2875502 RepID=A0ABS8BNA1_9NEIS|nr:electron transport complex subunit RsxC [Deefgea salmonis]MCB5197205.1 electron transport complex subunit RsxC [Deefgea salmonis]
MSATLSHEIFPFHGGVHPPEMKDLSNRSPIVAMPIPARLSIPLQQSIGNIAQPLVSVGDRVLKGQMLAAANGNISAAVHAPTSGQVIALGAQAVAHPSGLTQICLTLASDGLDEWIAREKFDWRAALQGGDAKAIREYVQNMGVVGQGGAVFPSHLKLISREPLDTLIINGAECEPYITCDDRLMRERAIEIVAGIAIVRQLLNAKQVLIGIEDNKPEAIEALRAALMGCGFSAQVVVVPTLYPSGGAKQLIKLLTNIEVPSGVRSTDLGVQCFNVATIYSIYAALEHAEPVISRVVTLTGNVEKPCNVEALIGTPIDDLLKFAGLKSPSDCIYGGPMMGFTLPSTQVGLTKAGNCIIAMDAANFPEKPREMPCIRCGECAVACPQELQPMDLYWFARSKNFGKAQERNLFDCIECGACAYVCPSSIQLVDYYRFAKSEIWDAERAKKSADTARERHEFKQFREEREKEEKAARLAARAGGQSVSARASPKPLVTEAAAPEASVAPAVDGDDKAAKIRAAMARAAAAKGETPASSAAAPALDTDKAAKIKAAMAAAAAKKAAANTPTEHGAVGVAGAGLQQDTAAKPTIDEEKAAKIRAAMAAAAAKKAEKAVKDAKDAGKPVPSPVVAPAVVEKPAIDEEKAAKIRAAMAAAAAKKAEKAAKDAGESVPSPVVAPAAVEKPAIDEEKAAKIRAAMAAAAAKKAAKPAAEGKE